MTDTPDMERVAERLAKYAAWLSGEPADDLKALLSEREALIARAAGMQSAAVDLMNIANAQEARALAAEARATQAEEERDEANAQLASVHEEYAFCRERLMAQTEALQAAERAAWKPDRGTLARTIDPLAFKTLEEEVARIRTLLQALHEKPDEAEILSLAADNLDDFHRAQPRAFAIADAILALSPRNSEAGGG